MSVLCFVCLCCVLYVCAVFCMSVLCFLCLCCVFCLWAIVDQGCHKELIVFAIKCRSNVLVAGQGFWVQHLMEAQIQLQSK